jgi:putative FmdB family regulatory protein
MPIYEYQCEACGHVFEVIRKISDEPLVHCPDCGKPTLKKLLSAPAFRLKGSGWYETDFKGGDKKNVVQPDSSPKSASKDKSAGSGGTAGKKPSSSKD